jgi:hypothetical protein
LMARRKLTTLGSSLNVAGGQCLNLSGPMCEKSRSL